MELDDASCSSAINLPESFRIPQNVKVPNLVNPQMFEYTEATKYRSFSKKHHKASSKVFRRKRCRYEHSRITEILNRVEYENARKASAFKKREMTTIHEENFQYRKKKSKSKYKGRCITCNKIAKKENKNKVASLKEIISRLQNTLLSKPEALQSHIPDETLQLFQKIHISDSLK